MKYTCKHVKIKISITIRSICKECVHTGQVDFGNFNNIFLSPLQLVMFKKIKMNTYNYIFFAVLKFSRETNSC